MEGWNGCSEWLDVAAFALASELGVMDVNAPDPSVLPLALYLNLYPLTLPSSYPLFPPPLCPPFSLYPVSTFPLRSVRPLYPDPPSPSPPLIALLFLYGRPQRPNAPSRPPGEWFIEC